MNKVWKSGIRTLTTMKQAKKLDKLSADEIIKNVDNFLFDCDGVLWHGHNEEIPGCKETVQKLHKLGKKIFYVTNNSSKMRKQIMEKCHKFGYPADIDNVMGTAHASAQYLKNTGFDGTVYLVGNPNLAGELDECGIKYIGLELDAPSGVESGFDDVVKFQQEWKPDPEVKGCLVGFEPNHNYRKMIKAASYARNPDNVFIATNEDAFLPTNGDVVIPGTGSIVASVKIPARREPLIIGKPNTTMFDLLHESHGLEASRTMMVGDSLNTDIAMASNCKLRSMLVLTGVDSVERVEALQKEGETLRVPEFYSQSLAQLGEFIGGNI